MKKKFFNALLMAAILANATFLSSCSKDDDDDDDDVTKQTEQTESDNQTTEKGATTNEGTTNGGTTNEGTTNNDETTNNNEETTPSKDFADVDCLNGSNYYIICLNSLATDYLESKGTIDGNLSIDDVNTAFYIWDGTCDGASLKGKDCFGKDSNGGMSLKGKSNKGWCGSGWCRLGDFDFSKIDESYTLHFAIRGDGSDDESYIAFGDPNLSGKEFKPTNKNGIKDLNGKTFSTDTKGEWVEYEYSIGDLIDAGVEFISYHKGINKNGEEVKDNNGEGKAINFPAIGGFQGATVDIDAIFIYKKK